MQLPQTEVLDLPQGIAWQFIHQHDLAWHFEAGKLAPQVGSAGARAFLISAPIASIATRA